MNKKEKKAFLSNLGVDLGENKRYTDWEIDRLHEIAANKEQYNNRTGSKQSTYTSWCSDGKYTRNTKTTYTCKIDENGLRVEEHEHYEDDDGQSGDRTVIHRKAREILGCMSHLMK